MGSVKVYKEASKFWDDETNQRQRMEDIGAKFGIAADDLGGWYAITSDEFIRS